MDRKNGNTEYYLGLDMGTNSVGWAVTTPGYDVVKKHGKALWGIRLFEEGKTAADRRAFRTARRRTARRSRRLDLLQELFAPAVTAKDPGFFQRLNDARYLPDDKKEEQKNTLFFDPDFTDKDYHKAYPTIYHLRLDLMKTDGPRDVRLVYLALHHLIKHRGHFLFESYNPGQGGQEGRQAAEQFFNTTREVLDAELPAGKEEETALILEDKTYGIRDKAARLCVLWGDSKSKMYKALASLLAGGKVKLSVLYGDEALKDADPKDVSLSDAGYDDNAVKLQSALGDRFDLISSAKAVYDWSLLAELMDGCSTLSEAKVKIYEKHKADLARLKKFLRPHPAVYKTMFQSAEKGSYASYAGVHKVHGKKQPIASRVQYDEFLDGLKKVLAKLPPSPEREEILQEIDAKRFLPKSVSKDNGVIPYQLQEKEMKLILEHASRYLPFLNESDGKWTVKEKILSLLTFRIPYYVGPLNTHDKEKGFAWAVRKDPEGHIYPWNFSEKIDVEASAEAFIRNLTNKCTYLLGEDVLPKCSLLYSEYMVLNELNNVKLPAGPGAGEEEERKLGQREKEQIIAELFMKKSKVTAKMLEKFLQQERILQKGEHISGIDGDFKASLVSWRDLDRILGAGKYSRAEREDMIRLITIFGAERSMLRRQLKMRHPGLSGKQADDLSRLRYKDWGRLSEKFLTKIRPDQNPLVNPATGEVENIIEAMRTHPLNLMQILSSDYGYRDAVDKLNDAKAGGKTFNYHSLEEMDLSPSVRRPVWQTLAIIKEVCHIMGGAPSRIFVEMARGKEAASKRTRSRREQLLELYKNCGKDAREWTEKLKNAPDEALRSDRLYLYYTQMGRCMYTGETICLEDLQNSNVYDVDHIYPQSKTADDSLVNRVLVKRQVNANKSDEYPLAAAIQQKMRPFWSVLLQKGLIPEEKYRRLTRTTGLSAEELASFVGRQLVETRQSTKAAAEILRRLYPDTKIVYAKAGNASRFRQDYGFIKVRDVNDQHHAKDAYLNVVVGNVYFTKFTADPRNFFREANHVYSLNQAMYKYPVIRDGVTAWVPGEDGTIRTVRRWMGKHNILYTRLAHRQTGGFFDQLLVKKGSGQVPIKQDGPISNISRYGGYNKAAIAYFMCVEAQNKKKGALLLVPVPLYLADQLHSDADREAYCQSFWEANGKDFTEPHIKIREIKYDALLEIDGFRAHISGRSNMRVLLRNAVQLCLDQDDERLIKRISKFLNRKALSKEERITDFDQITERNTMKLYQMFERKTKMAVYSKKSDVLRENLEKGLEKFCKLSVEDRCNVLNEILHFFQCDRTLSDFSKIGGPKKTGTLLQGFDLTDESNIFLVEQSVTGFYERKIPLTLSDPS